MNNLIEVFRPFAKDRFQMDIEVSKYLGGNIIKRQELLQRLTGNIVPLKECTISNVSNNLIYYFSQPQLF